MQTISREELRQRIDESNDFLLLNVLSEENFEDEHIPGSQNIPFDDDDSDFAHRVEELVSDKNDYIVAYCASAECPASTNAASALEKAGFTNVRVYEGGMREWKDSGCPLEGEQALTQAKPDNNKDKGGFSHAHNQT